MKLYTVAQRGNQFRAGLIDGTITFKTDTMSLAAIKFIPYADVVSKKQIKDLSDFVPFFAWMDQELLSIFAGDLPYDQGLNDSFTDLPYDADAICYAILGLIDVDRLWVNKKSILIC